MMQARHRHWALIAALTVVLILVGRAASAFEPPPRTAHVVDESSKIAPDDLVDLNTELHRIQETTGRQIAALVLPTLGGESIGDVAFATAKAWGPGHAGMDDGVVMVVALREHLVRIEVGKGIEGALPDLKCSDIIAGSIAPALRVGDIAGGIRLGAYAIMGVLGPIGSSSSRPVGSSSIPSQDPSPWPAIVFLAFFCMAVAVFVKFLQRRPTWRSWESNRGWDSPRWLTSGPTDRDDWDIGGRSASSLTLFDQDSSGPSSSPSGNDDSFGGGDFGGGGATGSF